MDTESQTASRHPLLRRQVVFLLAVIGAALLLSSCAAERNPVVGTGEDSPGFLMGLWHGIIIFFTFVISLFTDDVSVYEVANDGNWYDFGFFFGLMISLGGSGAGARRRKRRR
ncbi:MAG: hypothetical protein ACRDHM_07020 [Actinomycetota bacterium]